MNATLTHCSRRRGRTKNTQNQTNSSGTAWHIKAWCILRVHCRKWVLHLHPVDAGAATPKNTKKAKIRQKNSEAYLTSKAW
jgi:hypothetical protein